MNYEERAGLPGYWSYNGLPVHAPLETHRFVLDFARKHLTAGATILDVAAGEGALSSALTDAGFHVSCTSWDGKVALPIDTYNVNLDMPFSTVDTGGRRHDLVCCIEIIEHVENPAAFLRSCRDLLTSTGRLILSTPNVEHVAARVQWFVRGCPRIFEGDEVRCNRHISMPWREGLELLLEAAGFAIEGKHFLGSPQLGGPIGAALKRPLYWVLERILPGEPRGFSRLYVLKPSEERSPSLGAGDVF